MLEVEVIQTIDAIMLSSLQARAHSLRDRAKNVPYLDVVQVETALSSLSAREPSAAAVAQFQTVAPKLWDSLFKVRSVHFPAFEINCLTGDIMLFSGGVIL